MKRTILGYEFTIEELDILYDFIWDGLTSLSFRGKVEVIFRIIFNKRPHIKGGGMTRGQRGTYAGEGSEGTTQGDF